MGVENKVAEYKNKIIDGRCINLIPVEEKYFKDIIELRNQNRCKYYLNQPFDLTIEMQRKWYDDYKKRNNDIYWVIQNKKGRTVGAIRLYDITSDICDLGSFIVDEQDSMGQPFALETFVICIDFAFNVLQVKNIINEDKCDNKMMNSISKKFGFKYIRETEIRGEKYNYYLLDKESSKVDKYKKLLDEFMNGR